MPSTKGKARSGDKLPRTTIRNRYGGSHRWRTGSQRDAVSQYCPAQGKGQLSGLSARQLSAIPASPVMLPDLQQTAQFQPLPDLQQTALFQPLPDLQQTAQFQPLPDLQQTAQFQPLPIFTETAQFQSFPDLQQTAQFQPLPDLQQTAQFQPLPIFTETAQFQSFPDLQQTAQFKPFPDSQTVHSQLIAVSPAVQAKRTDRPTSQGMHLPVIHSL